MSHREYDPSETQFGRPPIGTAELLKERENVHAMPQQTAIEGNIALFPPNDLDGLRGRWRDIQGCFVDEPREAVRKADELVAEVIQRLAEVFANERSKMEQNLGAATDVSTEDLRQALRHYRSFFDRLLSV